MQRGQRWNLAPLDARCEAVERAEVRFRESVRRVHAENIGLAELPDGTRLVRVGEALPGELAAWRYGDELRRRRRRFWFETGFGAVVGLMSGAPPVPARASPGGPRDGRPQRNVRFVLASSIPA